MCYYILCTIPNSIGKVFVPVQKVLLQYTPFVVYAPFVRLYLEKRITFADL